MWFDPRELQKQYGAPCDFRDFSDFSNYLPLKVAEIAKVATPSFLKSKEREIILAWLEAIGERNAEAIAKVIRQCQEDVAAHNYFLGMAMAHKATSTGGEDDRRYCNQCANLSSTGQCMAAWQG
jgi:hypothetical protein